MPSTAKQRKKEEEGGLSWRWFESTAQRWPWLCSVWWRLRPRLWGLHVTLASSLLPFPLLPTVRNAAVPSHAVQCHPGKSELCLAPFILLQWPEGLPGSIQSRHSRFFSSSSSFLLPCKWNCLFSLIQPQLTNKSRGICCSTQLQRRILP